MLRIVLGFMLTASFAAAQPTIYGSAYSGPSSPATFYSINPANGSATAIGSIGFNRVGAMSFSPGGTLYAIGTSASVIRLLTINVSTGAGTAVGAGATGSPNCQDIAFRSDGTLFGYCEGDLYTFNTTTGVGTLVGTVDDFGDGNGLAFSPGGVLYHADESSLYSIVPATGVETVVHSLAYSSSFGSGGPRANGMKFDPVTGTLWASVVDDESGNMLGTINIASGVVTFVGNSAAGLDAIAVLTGSAAPTPTTAIPALSSFALVLLAVGLILIGGWTHWRRRRPTAI